MSRSESFFKKYKSLIICTSVITISIVAFFIFKNEISYGLDLLRDGEKIKEFLISFGPLSKIVFILLQIIQVVIFVIPGEIIQTAGGYVFGTWRGALLSIVGINIGVSILFLLAKRYKESLANKFVPEGFRERFQKLLNAKRITLIVFLVYLLPGIPKDGLVLVCGLSRINFKKFMIYSTLGRMPALVVSSYYGQNLALGNKTIVIAVTIIVLGVFSVGLIFKDIIFKSLEKVK